jgi:23S rRNA (guanosine2251-2'-O)-methyltransferase
MRNNKSLNQKYKNQKNNQQTAKYRSKASANKPNKATHADEPLEKYRLTVGLHSVREAIKVRPGKVIKVLLRQAWNTSSELREIYDFACAKKISIEEKSPSFFDRLTNTNQGVAAYISETPNWTEKTATNSTHSIIVGLDGIEDPHNLGAVIRTSWLLGVEGIITPEDRAVGLTPTVHKVASGGVEHVPVLQVNNFSKQLEILKNNGFWIFGLAAEGKVALYDLKLPEKVVWLIGAEDKGLRVTTKKLCDELVRIPQINADASYNASVAASIAISETYRQHQIQKK